MRRVSDEEKRDAMRAAEPAQRARSGASAARSSSRGAPRATARHRDVASTLISVRSLQTTAAAATAAPCRAGSGFLEAVADAVERLDHLEVVVDRP